jgi:putative transcriptional regulator
MSKLTISAKTRRDGSLVRIRPDGKEERLSAATFDPMTMSEIEAAAARDADNTPLTRQRLAQLRRVPRVKTLRRALALTQEEFAARYQIPLGTLRDWEQGRTEPDQPARSYLTVIARDPDGVRRALAPRRPRSVPRRSKLAG